MRSRLGFPANLPLPLLPLPRSQGATISFQLQPATAGINLPQQTLDVFSTRPETIYGVTFLAVHPQHPLAPLAAQIRARHPLTGALLPVLAAPYVVESYGTGAVMGVPGHDERDLQFAREQQLPVTSVIDDERQVMVNSGPLDGLSPTDAQAECLRLLETQQAGQRQTTYRLGGVNEGLL